MKKQINSSPNIIDIPVDITQEHIMSFMNKNDWNITMLWIGSIEDWIQVITKHSSRVHCGSRGVGGNKFIQFNTQHNKLNEPTIQHKKPNQSKTQ